MNRLLLGAQFLTAGSGGICRAARLSILALQGHADITALAVEDRGMHHVDSVEVTGCSGHRIPFLLRNNYELLRAGRALYDFAGTARAHFVPRSYAVWVHGNEFWNESEVRTDYMRAIRSSDCILLNSQTTADAVQARLGLLPQARVCWLGTEQDHAPAAGPAVEGPPTVLFVGRSDEHFAKGQDILIRLWPRVVAAVKDARLCFVGGGTRTGRLRDLAASSPASGNIDVLGFLPEHEMEELWPKATALALLGRLEGFGLVVIEAMRHGVPVLASTNDAASEINLNGVTGYNVDRTNDEAIVDRLVGMLRDRDGARTMGAAGFARWNAHFRFSVFRERFLAAIGPWLDS